MAQGQVLLEEGKLAEAEPLLVEAAARPGPGGEVRLRWHDGTCQFESSETRGHLWRRTRPRNFAKLPTKNRKLCMCQMAHMCMHMCMCMHMHMSHVHVHVHMWCLICQIKVEISTTPYIIEIDGVLLVKKHAASRVSWHATAHTHTARRFEFAPLSYISPHPGPGPAPATHAAPGTRGRRAPGAASRVGRGGCRAPRTRDAGGEMFCAHTQRAV